jgi:tight adherence protein C
MAGMNSFYLYGICLLWALCAAGLAGYAFRIAQEVSYVTLADGRQQERRLPLIFRLLLPFSGNLGPLVKRPELQGLRDHLAGRLIAAGFEGLLSAEEFLALRVLVPLVPGIVGVGMLHFCFTLPPFQVAIVLARQEFLVDVLWVLWFIAYPGIWLRRAILDRHRSMQKALPFVLDLLTLSVEAGMDFMSAIQRILDRRPMDPIGEELLRVLHEIQLGKPRREALRAMALRVDQPDVRNVLHAMVQADELGVGIGTILRIQSDQTRNKRFERAEKLANEAPVKLLFPLLACIFPAVFLILLGPILREMLHRL